MYKITLDYFSRRKRTETLEFTLFEFPHTIEREREKIIRERVCGEKERERKRERNSGEEIERERALRLV